MYSKIFTCLSILLLSACATEPNYRSANTSKVGEGRFLVRVLPNIPTEQSLNFAQHLVIEKDAVDSTKKPTSYTMSPVLDGTSRSLLFTASLPPGNYRITHISVQQCYGLCTQGTIVVTDKFSRFEIKGGSLTDLGVIVEFKNPLVENKFFLAHDLIQNENRLPLKEVLPDFNQFLTQPILSWLPETVNPVTTKLMDVTKKVSYGLVSPSEIQDGHFIFGSANGVVYKWLPGEVAHPFDLGERKSVEAVLSTTTGNWVAGGELGLLRESSDKGLHWRDIKGNLPFGVVLSLFQWRDKIVATVVKGKTIYVQAASLGSTQWQPLAQYEMDISAFWDIPGVTPKSFLLGDKLVTPIPGRKLGVLDLASGQNGLSNLPGGFQSFTASADGVLRCRCVVGIITNPYESHDMGKTWQGSNISRAMFSPTFKDEKNGVAFIGAYFAPSKLMYTRDGGKTWLDSAPTQLSVKHFFYSKDGRSVYAVDTYGPVWVSKDDGQSWHRLGRHQPTLDEAALEL